MMATPSTMAYSPRPVSTGQQASTPTATGPGGISGEQWLLVAGIGLAATLGGLYLDSRICGAYLSGAFVPLGLGAAGLAWYHLDAHNRNEQRTAAATRQAP